MIPRCARALCAFRLVFCVAMLFGASPLGASPHVLAQSQDAPAAPPALSPPVPLEPVISGSWLDEAKAQNANIAQKRRKRRLPLLGADLDSYFLLDSKTRRFFGSSMLDLSPGIGSAGVNPRGSVDFDLSLLGNSKLEGNGITNKFSVVFAGAGYSRPLKTLHDGEPVPFLFPYFGASVGAVYADVNAPGAGVKGSTPGTTASVFLGVSLRERACVEARLRGATPTKGFNFSDVGLSFGARF